MKKKNISKEIGQLRMEILKYKKYGRMTDMYEGMFDRDPQNTELEEKADAAYAKHFDALQAAAKIIVSLIHVDTKIARKMVITQTDKVLDLTYRVQ